MKKSTVSQRVEEFCVSVGATNVSQGSRAIIRDAFRREQGVGAVRERKRYVPNIPGGLMVLVPDTEDHSRHTAACRQLPDGPVRINGASYFICVAGCPVAHAWLDELRKRGAK